MKKNIFYILLLLFSLLTASLAEAKPKTVIIFDASGSMWGQINGVAKIEIAKSTLKDVIKGWNPSVDLGLTVYGHRRKGDCSDIESVIPVGKVNKKKVIRTVMGINPKGKTPISRALRQVADELKYTEEKATIILISDGKETCDADPCATAKALEKEGIDFVTHVIGFNVDRKTDAQLECIAKATGGAYFSAKNATALNKAMKTIVKKVAVKKPEVKKMELVKVIPIGERRIIMPFEEERPMIMPLEDNRPTVRPMEIERKRIMPMPETRSLIAPMKDNRPFVEALKEEVTETNASAVLN